MTDNPIEIVTASNSEMLVQTVSKRVNHGHRTSKRLLKMVNRDDSYRETSQEPEQHQHNKQHRHCDREADIEIAAQDKQRSIV